MKFTDYIVSADITHETREHVLALWNAIVEAVGDVICMIGGDAE